MRKRTYEMLRSNISGELLRREDLRRSGDRLFTNFTEFFNRLFLSPVPEGRVDDRQLSIIGRKGSGKTSAIAYIHELVHSVYAAVPRNVVYADDLDVAIAHMDDRPLQLIILDDAAGAAASRRAAANVKKVQDYNMLRHILEDKQKDAGYRYDGGLVLIIIAWQRKNDLERALRDGADFQLYKTPPNEPEDHRALEDLIGSHYMRKLEEITYRVLDGDQNAKGTSIGMIPVLGRRGVGIYRTQKASVRLPEMITAEKYRKQQLAALGASEGTTMSDAAKRKYGPEDALRMHEELGMSYSEISAEVGKSKTTVQRWIKQALEELSEG